MYSPLTKIPLLGSNSTLRIPKGVSYTSIVFPPCCNVVTAKYRFGCWFGSGPHNLGFAISTVPDTAFLAPGSIEVLSVSTLETTAPFFRSFSSSTKMLVMVSTSTSSWLLLSIVISILTLAYSRETSVVVIYVPHWVTWTGFVIVSQTFRYNPAPGYQRAE